MSGRVLVIDDDLDARELLAANLGMYGYEVESCGSAEEGLAHVEAQPFDIVLTDVHMPGRSGIELCEQLSERHPQLGVIVMTGQADMHTAIAALRAGAFDFVLKPVQLEQLLHRLAQAVQHGELREELRRLQRTLASPPRSQMVGESPALRRVHELVARVSESDVPVLVSGESGVGKELVARELHASSAYGEGPFVALNCAAVPAELLESELFGHARGAFTGAKRAREGLFLRARGGSLFLDEIGELPLEMQPKLLRALQERRVRPVGSDESVPFDARVISATNRDLEEEVEAGRFREDLYYRLNVINIHVPALRARPRDVLPLAQHFVSAIAERTGRPPKTIEATAASKLLSYDWPGNVRELENCIERAVVLARSEEITVADLPDRVSRFEPSQLVIPTDDPDQLPTLAELEARYIRRVLRAVKGNKSQAAEVLGLARRTLYRRLERLEREPEPGEPGEQEPGTDEALGASSP